MRKTYRMAQLDASRVHLETKRLIIRGWRDSDLNDLYEYASVDGVGQMAGWLPHINLDHSKTVLFNFVTNKNVFALELKDNNKVIGSIGIEKIYKNLLSDGFNSLSGREVGYVLSKQYWGLGLMAEALKPLIDFLFLKMDYDYLMCAHFKSNLQSKRVIEKVGFKFVKEISIDTKFDKVVPTFLYVQINKRKDLILLK